MSLYELKGAIRLDPPLNPQEMDWLLAFLRFYPRRDHALQPEERRELATASINALALTYADLARNVREVPRGYELGLAGYVGIGPADAVEGCWWTPTPNGDALVWDERTAGSSWADSRPERWLELLFGHFLAPEPLADLVAPWFFSNRSVGGWLGDHALSGVVHVVQNGKLAYAIKAEGYTIRKLEQIRDDQPLPAATPYVDPASDRDFDPDVTGAAQMRDLLNTILTDLVEVQHLWEQPQLQLATLQRLANRTRVLRVIQPLYTDAVRDFERLVLQERRANVGRNVVDEPAISGYDVQVRTLYHTPPQG